MSFSDPYIYPGTIVLRNRFGITDAEEFERIERNLVADRIAEGVLTGRFDLEHLCSIHRHLFQDVFDWAGKSRTIEIAKDGHQFQFHRFIEIGMADVYQRLESADFLRGLNRSDFLGRQGKSLVMLITFTPSEREMGAPSSATWSSLQSKRDIPSTYLALIQPVGLLHRVLPTMPTTHK